jgi:hypothetical protein
MYFQRGIARANPVKRQGLPVFVHLKGIVFAAWRDVLRSCRGKICVTERDKFVTIFPRVL